MLGDQITLVALLWIMFCDNLIPVKTRDYFSIVSDWAFLSDDVMSHRFMLACWILFDSDFVALLSVALLSRTFNPYVETKCTLGFAVCRFNEVLLILAFKRRFRVVFWLMQYRINLHSPSVEAKCTLGFAVCRFSGVLLILAFKRRFRVVFWLTQYRINLHSPANIIIRTYPPYLCSCAFTVISNCEVCACNFGNFQTDLRTIA